MARKVALITGITGQDGSYLAELLLEKGYEVHGIARRTSQLNRARIDDAREHALSAGKVYELHYGDMGDSSSPFPSQTISKPASGAARSMNSRTVCVSPVATTKSSGAGCCSMTHIISTKSGA